VTVTKPVDSRLASRRKALKEEREASNAVSITYVLPDIATVLGQIQAVAGVEIDRMARAQAQDPESRLDLDDVKKLSGLTNAVAEAHKVSTTIRDDDLKGLTLEELRALLSDEIDTEGEQARKVIASHAEVPRVPEPVVRDRS
jgi:hypothetical protein